MSFHLKSPNKNLLPYSNIMKKHLFFLIFIFTNISLFATNYKVLFLGNSYTSVNDLPQMVSAVSLSAGDTITVTTNAPSGCTFQQHLSVSASMIQQGGWDYVVLQEQSQLPSFPIDQFMQESYPYAKQLCQMISQYNPQAEVVFYMTWGRKNGDQNNAVSFPILGTYDGMDSLLHARYMMMAEDNDAIVSPVGAVWHYIRRHYPNIELNSTDESHPSLAGSYAAACSFYTVFFQKSPMLITDDACVDAYTARIIRQVTNTVVFDSLNKWLSPISVVNTTESPDTVSASINKALTISLFPNPIVQYMHIKLSRVNVQPYHVYIYNKQGVLIQQYMNLEDTDHLLDLSGIDEGMYMLVVELSDHTRYVKKFIKSL